MNPIVHMKNNGRVVYELIKEDFSRLRKIKVKAGKSYGSEDQMCIMQAVSALTTERDGPKLSPAGRPQSHISATGYSDHPLCVSATIVEAMIDINDSIKSDRTRARLKQLVPEVVNTAPVKLVGISEVRDVSDAFYNKAERERKRILAGLFDSSGNLVALSKCMELIREAAAVRHFTD